jgi:uncharacterized delta-60 repeat protein
MRKISSGDITIQILEPRRLFAAGDPDSTFGTAGVTPVPHSQILAQATQPAIESDDTILLLRSPVTINGQTFPIGVEHYNANGILDTNFGTAGQAGIVFDSTQGRDNEPTGIASLPNDKILVFGTASHTEQTQDQPIFITINYVARLKADGTLDTAFGNNGQMVLSFDFDPRKFAVQSDGKLVAVTNSHTVERFNSDFSTDQSFDLSSILQLINADLDTITIQPGGKILFGGSLSITHTDQTKLLVGRLTTSFTLDPKFGTGGFIAKVLPGTGHSSAVQLIAQSNNKTIVAAKDGDPQIDGVGTTTVVRLNPDGVLDSTFGTGGISAIDFGTPLTIKQINLDSAGRIITSSGDHSLYMARLTTTGQIDPTFGQIVDDGQFTSAPSLQSTNQLVITGSSPFDNSGNLVMFRLDADGAGSPIIGVASQTLSITGTDNIDLIQAIQNNTQLTALRNHLGRLFNISDLNQIDIDAMGGDDLVSMDGVFLNSSISGGAGNDRIAGGVLGDTIFGDAGNDLINGGRGGDSLYGGTGRDKLTGAGGSDHMHGGAGNDILNGQGGNDQLSGDGGNDLLYGGAGFDVLHGNAGNDRLLSIDGERDDLFGDGGHDSATADKIDILISIESS